MGCTFEIILTDHVSCSVPRPIHRPMHRSIYRSLLDRPSTDTRLRCRSTVDRESTNVSVELPLMSAEVSTVTISGVYRSTTGGISVNYRRNVGRVSFNSRARVYRYYLPIFYHFKFYNNCKYLICLNFIMYLVSNRWRATLWKRCF